MKLFTIIGARPQFIKASVVSKALCETPGLSEVIVHTGQHFDSNMSEVFFDQLNIPRPQFKLDIHGGSHGEMTGRMLIEIERLLLSEKPDRVIVYGDTNSTLAGALAASKLHIPVAHIEAGLRSFNMRMPEEINRILTDQVSDILYCPTITAINNLSAEGFGKKNATMLNVGDVMQDSSLLFSQRAVKPDVVNIEGDFVLATLHRAENTDDISRLSKIVSALNTVHHTVAHIILPLHPRTRTVIEKAGLKVDFQIINPVGYFEMLWLLQHTGLVLTDSGGVQKEAFFFGKPCLTMRDETEWVELVDINANQLVGADCEKIINACQINFGRKISDANNLYGGGQAALNIAMHLSALI